ncbi:TRL-like family protein [Leptospira fluminis]|uniref:TRL-like family protein n=1 Tax=Leptospira fluminis TaxID=2484979 RepID=A0A4R9GQR6_9LEPT|nr:TRL-like family protein [Leptospira fluminis]TGK18981.1 TRL-like family protein [Leptospira fluminis]
MKIGFLFLPTFFWLFSVNCTGYNALYYGYGIAPNTNPTKEYTNPNYLIVKGGAIVHSGSIPGPIGRNADSKLSGSGCSYSILGLVSFGDSSIENAKEQGKISRVAGVEYEQFGVFGGWIFHRFCTVVSGSTNDSSIPDGKSDAAKPTIGKKK